MFLSSLNIFTFNNQKLQWTLVSLPLCVKAPETQDTSGPVSQ